MIEATLVFLVREQEVLLGYKKVGFGKGKWNGAGGKLEQGETPEQAAARETQEELLVTVNEEDLEKVAELEFRFPDKPEWDMFGHIYFLREWDGRPQETRELRPRWWRFEDIPYEQMWDDDKYWYPLVLEGLFVKASFSFDNHGLVTDAEFERPEGHAAKPLNADGAPQ